jgi:hypothetical protein
MSLLSKQDIENAGFMRLCRLSDDGDADAPVLLHRLLSEHLSANTLTPCMRKFLAEMTASLAAGHDPAAATLIKPTKGRPAKILRDERVCKFIADRVAFFDYATANRARIEAKFGALPERPSMTAIYAAAALEFKIKPARAKAIHLGLRSKGAAAEQA